MPEQGDTSIIHRKARHGRAGFDARAMSPSKALRLALETCGDDLFDLALTVRAMEQRKLAHAALRDAVAADCLIIALDGAGGARGALCLDRPFVQALVEIQTLGHVTPAQATERAFTATDAAMAAPLIDRMLTDFDAKLAEARAAHVPLGFRFGDRIEDSRALMLALDANDFQMFKVTVDIGRGTSIGELSLILPEAALLASDAPPGADAPEFDLSDLALAAPVTLDAVLARVAMPLAKVCALEPGGTLILPASALARAELVAAGNHVVARVRLGQMNGLRAVRLEDGDAFPAPRADAGSEPGDGTRQRPEAGRDADVGRAPPVMARAGPAPGMTHAGMESFERGDIEIDLPLSATAQSATAQSPTAQAPSDGGGGALPDPTAEQPSGAKADAAGALPALPDLPAL